MRNQAAINEMQFDFMLVRESTDSVFISEDLLKNYQAKGFISHLYILRKLLNEFLGKFPRRFGITR